MRRTLLLFTTCLLAACTSQEQAVKPAGGRVARVVATQTGIASIYKDHRTASGERYSATAFTAAHRTWPMNCTCRCTNLDNGRWVVVRINDRGPFMRGRVIDLTPVAAHAIGLSPRLGVCRVKIERFE